MDNPLHIRVFCAPERAAAHLSVLGSLPATFRVLDAGQPDIALVGPEAASIAAGLASNARALVVVDPWAVDDIATLVGSPVAVIPVGNVLPVVSDLDAGGLAETTLVRCSLAGRGSLAATMYEQLSALEALFGPLGGIALLSRHGPAYAGTARTGKGVEVLWSGQSEAPRDSFELDILGPAQRLEVCATPDGTARPADIRLGNADGLMQARGVYESGLRLLWRRLAADLAGGARTARLSDFVNLLAQVRQFTHLA